MDPGALTTEPGSLGDRARAALAEETRAWERQRKQLVADWSAHRAQQLIALLDQRLGVQRVTEQITHNERSALVTVDGLAFACMSPNCTADGDWYGNDHVLYLLWPCAQRGCTHWTRHPIESLLALGRVLSQESSWCCEVCQRAEAQRRAPVPEAGSNAELNIRIELAIREVLRPLLRDLAEGL